MLGAAGPREPVSVGEPGAARAREGDGDRRDDQPWRCGVGRSGADRQDPQTDRRAETERGYGEQHDGYVLKRWRLVRLTHRHSRSNEDQGEEPHPGER